MKRFVFFALVMALFVPVYANAVAPDMSISAKDIYFSESTLISGEQTRIYAKVKNVGDSDISAYVFFYQGSTPIGPSQIVSTVNNGEDDEVWVDFTIPYGSFNIRAEIKGSDPQDINPANDVAITNLFHPIVDEDRDEIEDDLDNCSDDYNPNQVDTDGDGLGDVCDGDDDGDSLSDEVENELGTDTLNTDTDGDGIDDANDYDPVDPDITEAPAEVEIISQQDDSQKTSNNFFENLKNSISDKFQGTENISIEDEIEDIEEIEDIGSSSMLSISPNASFVYMPLSWRMYGFSALVPESEQVSLNWDFGDGYTSTEKNVEHTFSKFGKYQVTLSVESLDGGMQSDTQEIVISFFHMGNPFVIFTLVGILFFVILMSLLILFKNRIAKKIE